MITPSPQELASGLARAMRAFADSLAQAAEQMRRYLTILPAPPRARPHPRTAPHLREALRARPALHAHHHPAPRQHRRQHR